MTFQSTKVFGGYLPNGSPVGIGKVHYCSYWDWPIFQLSRDDSCEEFIILGRRPNGLDLIVKRVGDFDVEDAQLAWDMAKAEKEEIFS